MADAQIKLSVIRVALMLTYLLSHVLHFISGDMMIKRQTHIIEQPGILI